MDIFLFLVGFLAMIIGTTILVINAVKKKPKKKALIVTISGLVLFITGISVGVATTDESEFARINAESAARKEAKKEEKAKKEEIALADKAKKDEEKKKKELALKEKQEAEKKAELEKKAKEEEAKKAAAAIKAKDEADKEALEVAAAKEKADKSKTTKPSDKEKKNVSIKARYSPEDEKILQESFVWYMDDQQNIITDIKPLNTNNYDVIYVFVKNDVKLLDDNKKQYLVDEWGNSIINLTTANLYGGDKSNQPMVHFKYQDGSSLADQKMFGGWKIK